MAVTIQSDPLQSKGNILVDGVPSFSFSSTGLSATNVVGSVSNTSVLATGTLSARSLQNRFADVINVKDFGAKGDGVTDDTAAIQNAINNNSNKIIFVPCGTYQITNKISLINSNKLLGASRTGVIFNASDSLNILFEISGDNCSIENITITRPQNSVLQNTNIKVLNNNRILLREIEMYYYYIGFEIDGTVINIENVNMWYGVGGSNSGGITLGKTYYTGPVNIQNLNMLNNTPSTLLHQPQYGIQAKYVDVITIDSALIIGHNKCFLINPENLQTAALIFVTNSTFDTAVRGISIEPIGTGQAIRSSFSNCAFQANTDTGVTLYETNSSALIEQIAFDNCHITTTPVDQPAAIGINIETNNSRVKNILFNNCTIFSCNDIGFRGEGNPLNIQFNNGIITKNSTGLAATSGADITFANTIIKDNIIQNFSLPASNSIKGILSILPTLSAGLSSGSIWRDAAAGNVLKIVP